MKRVLIFALTITLMLSLITFSAEAGCAEVYSFENLYEAAANGWTDEIRLMNSIDVYSTISVHPGSHLTITAANAGTILSHWEYSGPMFQIPEGSSLTIRGNEGAEITLSGAVNSSEENSCVVAEGSFVAEHVIFSNFSADTGAAVCLTDGNDSGKTDFSARFTTFQNCRARCGGAVYVGAGKRAEISSSLFTGNSAAESGASICSAGALVFGDNNMVADSDGPMNYEDDGNGGFVFGDSICGSGSFEKSWRTDVNGVVSWGGGAEPPEAVEVILLANGVEEGRQTVRCGANGYWEFSFRDLPIYAFGGPVAYDIGEYSIDGLRFDKRGEADVGFEVLYSPAQMSDGNVQMLLEGEQAVPEITEETEILSEPIPQEQIPESVFEYNNPVTVTKSPTSETVTVGGRTDFVARADNCTDITWHFISPDNSMNLNGIEAVMYLNGKASFYELNTERLTLTDISADLDGWRFQAEFAGNGGPVFSECASLYVITPETEAEAVSHAEQVIQDYFAAEEEKAAAEPTPEATPAPAPIPTPETTPRPDLPLDENIVITKQPSGETVKENGSAIFIAKAENCNSVLWHIISPEGSVDYAGEEILAAFSGVELEGVDEEKIKIKNIPVSMSGWGFEAEFISEEGHKLSEKAVITLEGYEQTGAQETPENEETPLMMQATAPASTPEEESENSAEPAETAAPSLPEQIAPVEATAIPVAIPTEAPSQTGQTAPEQAMQSITVTAQWLDNDNAAKTRPEGTIVQLFRDGSLYFTASLSASNGWTYTFTNLNGGNYRVQESGVANYAQNYSVNGSTITIQHTYIGTMPLTQSTPAAQPNQANAAPTPTASGETAPASTPAVQTAAPVATAAPNGNASSQGQEPISVLDGDGTYSFSSHSTSKIITLAAVAAAGVAVIALASVILVKNNRRRY